MYRPEFHAAPRLFRLLEQIATIREQVRSSLIKVPWVPLLVREAMARASWGSTAIEGCTLSLNAVKGLLEGKSPLGYPDRHIQMAQDYLNALAWLTKKDRTSPVREKDVFRLHRLIGAGAIKERAFGSPLARGLYPRASTAEVDPRAKPGAPAAVDEGPIGAYRKIDVRAGRHVCPPWKDVPKLMADLLEWLNGAGGELPAVFSSAILHHRFVEIHPFRDGNGRVGRALATWQLYRNGFDSLHVFALDEVLMENRALYIRNLERVQIEHQDLGGWLEFMAEAVLETIERVQRRIRTLGIRGEMPISLTVRQETLLRLLQERGPLGVRALAESLHLTAPGVHYALKPLIEQGLVKIEGKYKGTRYALV
jgi:Fic family protein